MNNEREFTEAEKKKLKLLMFQKNALRFLFIVGIIAILVVIVVAFVCKLADLEPPYGLLSVLVVIILATIPVAMFSERSVERKRAELRIRRTPDEIKADKKKAAKIHKLLESPGALDGLLARLDGMRKFSRVFIIIGVICCVGDVIMLFVSSNREVPEKVMVAAAAVTLIALGIGIGVFYVAINRQKGVARVYTPIALAGVMDTLERYDPYDWVDTDYITDDFCFPYYDRIGPCGDYLSGVIRGMRFEMSEFTLQYQKTTRDRDGSTTTEIVTSYTGAMVICRHNIKLNGVVTLSQCGRFKGETATESEPFNNLWSAKGDNEQEVFYLLTPQYMETLMRLTEEKGNIFAIKFRPDGTLMIALQNRDFFEADGARTTAALTERFTAEVDDLADILARIGAAVEPLTADK